DGELEAALAVGADLHPAADARVLDRDLALTRDALQGGVEAGGVAGGEELLGVGAVPGAPHLLRGRHGEVEGAVGGDDAAGAAGAGGEGFGGVQGFHGNLPFGGG